ncbi:hypothetical protein ACFX13_025123 [Malus domestica]|uniref:uncharacterized protein n=1 Tax=Malus domestica TaxID=3750 RepID=UPI003975B56E
MEEEAYSWIRRTKFSHWFDSSILAALSLALQNVQIAGLKSSPALTEVAEAEATHLKQKSSPSNSKIQRNSIHMPVRRNLLTNKQRSLSSVPQIHISDVFKEAKSDTKRFSTPHLKRKGLGRLFSKDLQSKSSNSMNTNPLRHLASMKVNDKTKSRKKSPWAKYFDHVGGRVNVVDAANEFYVDLSKLFLGLKFAHGAHSRLYHGIYNDEAVAVKIIRVQEDDEGGVLAARLEKQFNREVTL